MKKKEKATEAAPQTQCEDNKSSRIIQQVRHLFLSGRQFTAREINALTGGNDARKIISNLRNKERWNIQDIWLSGHKLYWLVADDRQLDLFSEEGGER